MCYFWLFNTILTKANQITQNSVISNRNLISSQTECLDIYYLTTWSRNQSLIIKHRIIDNIIFKSNLGNLKDFKCR